MRVVSKRGAPRAYTLLEALIASSILLIVVMAVSSAVTAGQQHAFAARQRILASIAADALLGRISVEDYSRLTSWHGYSESAGEMLGLNGDFMPDAFGDIGRDVTVESDFEEIEDLGLLIAGRRITVRAFDTDDQTLVELELFRPEPQS